MKFTENSLVVDVVKISNSSFKLSVPAGDLLTAAMNGAVLRRHDLSTAAVPNVLYVPLSEAKLSSGTYTFTFSSGDKFTASAADAYPAASSVSDNTDSELPAVGTSDKNKYLHTNGSTGAVEWSNVPNELPTVAAADKGKFLHTNDSTGAVEWADAPTELPSVSGADEGKVLTVNNSGVWVAANPSSSGGVLVVTESSETLNKTWQEIHDAGFSVLNDSGIIGLLSYCAYDGDANAYKVDYIDISGGASGFAYYTFSASTASDYPVRFYE